MVTVRGDVVEFRFFRPEASQVHLVGDFNHWHTNELPMVRSEDGYWLAQMRLPAGDFKFRYCADGIWYTDYAAFGVEHGRFGLDSIVRVVQPTLRMVKSAKEAEVAAA